MRLAKLLAFTEHKIVYGLGGSNCSLGQFMLMPNRLLHLTCFRPIVVNDGIMLLHQLASFRFHLSR